METVGYVDSGKLGRIPWARGLCYKLREGRGSFKIPQVQYYPLAVEQADRSDCGGT